MGTVDTFCVEITADRLPAAIYSDLIDRGPTIGRDHVRMRTSVEYLARKKSDETITVMGWIADGDLLLE